MIALALIVVAVVVLAVLALRPDPTERICDEYRPQPRRRPLPRW